MNRILQQTAYRLLQTAAAVATALAIGCGAEPSQEPKGALPTAAWGITRVDKDAIRTIDHYVPHVSTAVYTLDAGMPLEPTREHVKLFVREKVGRGLRANGEGDARGSDDGANQKARLPAVLFVPAATQPAVPVFDLPFTDITGKKPESYNWMTYLAEAGFDVFTMELTGYGLSPRPYMDDPCNTSALDQQKLLKNPCAELNYYPNKFPYAYKYKFTIQSDWDEIDRVVDYIRELRGVDKVSLIGWSSGGPRIGGYAAQSQYAGKVEKLVLYSPSMYDRIGPSQPPPGLLDEKGHLKRPEIGILMQLPTVANFRRNWDRQLAVSNASPDCGDLGQRNQMAPGIRDVIESGVLESDPVGSRWGTTPLWRAPAQNTFWGWNAEAVQKIRAPTLIIRGHNDDQAKFEPQRDLFEDLGGDQDPAAVQDGESDQDTESGQKGFRKVFVRIACAGHQLMFEKQHMRLLDASREWLRHTSYDGHHRGSFFVDIEGRITAAPLVTADRSFKVSGEDLQPD
jgi:pimeloyl-ACP methyl ester carboxylesterase